MEHTVLFVILYTSLAACIIISSLEISKRLLFVSRFFYQLLLLFGVGASCYLFVPIVLENKKISLLLQLSILPAPIGVIITPITFYLALSIMISSFILPHFLSGEDFATKMQSALFSFLFLFVLSTSTSLVICVVTLSVSSVVQHYYLFSDERRKEFIGELGRDFLWMRLSDLLLSFGLLWFLLKDEMSVLYDTINRSPNFHFYPSILIYLGLIMRLIVLSKLRAYEGSAMAQFHYVFGNLVNALGVLTILLRFHNFIIDKNQNNYFIIAVALGVVFHALYRVITYKDKATLGGNSFYLVSSTLLLMIFFFSNYILSIMISIFIVIYPLLSLVFLPKYHERTIVSKSEQYLLYGRENIIYDALVTTIPSSVSYSLGKLFMLFLVPIYSNFFLFRLPQIVIFILQAPLRIFHTGSIQKSLLFVVVLSLIYFWIIV